MDREKTHRKIDELATLISVNNNRMLLHEERIPQLDIDLLRKNAIELYEAINILHIQNLKDKRSAALLEEASVVEPENEVPVAEQKEVPIEPIEKIKEPVQDHGTETHPEKETKSENEPVVEKSHPKTTVEKAKKPEKAESSDKQHLYEKLTRSSIESIKKSISISKRYEVQAALFKNDPDAYNEAINRLDSCETAKEALNYLNSELKSSYEWDDEDPLVEELYMLVERRYA